MRTPLNAASDNVHLSRLGQVAAEAGSPLRRDVGDPIDRGVILLLLLDELGYDVAWRGERESVHLRREVFLGADN